jgi:hypothetical protein
VVGCCQHVMNFACVDCSARFAEVNGTWHDA